MSGVPAAWIDAARNTPIERVIHERGIRLRGRVERVGPCPVCGGQDRFAINVRKRLFNCRGCGRGGDVIALVQFLDSVSFLDACASLAGERATTKPRTTNISCSNLSVSRAVSLNHAADDDRRQRDKARALWRASLPASASPVERYLCGRSIIMPLPATVHYLAPLKPGHHHAMIVPFGLPDEPEPGMLDITDEKITAIQLTLLQPDGSGKANVKPNKITIGSPAGMPMVLAPMNDLMGLAIAEGVEDALSVHQATGLGAWASGGATFLPKLVAAVEQLAMREYDASPDCITVFADADEVGHRNASALAVDLVKLSAKLGQPNAAHFEVLLREAQ